MKIEEGKFYRDRSGRKAGPMASHPLFNDRWPFRCQDGFTYRLDGTQAYYEGVESPHDLIAEWTDGPVREVTRKEIVPGTYGRVRVEWMVEDQIVINLTDRDGNGIDRGNFSAAELRAAASTLTAIADALEETK